MIKKQILNNNWYFFYKDNWKISKVPGSIHLDLLSHGYIEDPFIGTKEKDVKWVSERDWNYKLNFNPDKTILMQKHIFILFEGLDTYAEIFLNNKKILSTNNMFHPWAADVKPILKSGLNELILTFRSAINEVSPKMKKLGYELPADNDQAGKTSPHTRKAPYHYGWDWGPSLVTSGIWKDVVLTGYNEFYFEELMISNVALKNEIAELNFELSVFSKVNTSVTIQIDEKKYNIHKKFDSKLEKGHNHIQKTIYVKKPDLWWPTGHGKQPLYTFFVEIFSNKTFINKNKKIGIRNVYIKREQDAKGESFEIHVNEVPIFSKGANWIPADSFTTRLDKNDYEKLIIAAKDANMNTLRIWGGGIYEPEIFYELCDKYGILVWQDFMFACSMYPADKKFLTSVEKEVRYQISRLKSYACIILWCGNNEIASGWLSWGWKEALPSKVWDDYKALFHELVPILCDELDPSRLYWPSSPGHDLNLPKSDQIYGSGDNHYWGVWHSGEPLEAFEKNVGRFMSEYGMQSFPSMKTIETFTTQKDRSINSEVMSFHQKASLGTGNLMMYIEKHYNVPKDFEKIVILSQIMQAEAIKYAVEAHRRNRPFCMGTLYWQFNDCWPGLSWSSIDYRGDWKALHFAAKDFYSPILTTINRNNDTIDVHIINDLNKVLIIDLNVSIRSFKGEVLFEKNMKKVELDPTSSKIHYRFEILPSGILESVDLLETFFYCECVSDGNIISKNELFFVKPKAMALKKPDYELSWKKNRNDVSVKIKAKSFLYRLLIQSLEIEGDFSDNYFHLQAGAFKEIVFHPNKTIDKLDENKLVFSLTSLYDLQKK